MSGSTGLGRRDDRGEDGNVAVLVAVLLLVFVGVAAISVDLGAGWALKRGLVTGMDSAALAGAQHLAANADACSGDEATRTAAEAEAEVVAEQFFDLNDAAEGTDPAVNASCADLTVDVEARREVARMFTAQPLVAGGHATARGVLPGAALPLTICSSALPEDWLVEDATQADVSKVTEPIEFDPEAPPCADIHGQPLEVGDRWGWFGAVDAAGIATLITGFPTDAVIELPPPDRVCRIQDEPPAVNNGWCVGIAGPGTEAPAEEPLLELLEHQVCPPEAMCDPLTILVHNRADASVDGVEYETLGFLEVLVRGVDIPEPEPPPDPDPDPDDPGDTDDPDDPGDTDDPDDSGDTDDPGDPGDTDDPDDPADAGAPEHPSITLEFRGYRAEARTVLRLGAGSYLCSVDGAPVADDGSRCGEP